MHNYYLSETDRINDLVRQNSPLTLRELAEKELMRFRNSRRRLDMFTGERYYEGNHDILRRVRTAIGEGGKTVELDNLPNNRIVNNIYRVLVDQKVNYLLGKPITVNCGDEECERRLRSCFNRDFFRILRRIGEDALNCGLGWLYVYYGSNGKPLFKRFRPWEVVPFWSDSEHTEVDCALRVYEVLTYVGKSERVQHRAELYTPEGVRRYSLEGSRLREEGGLQPYYSRGGRAFGFDRVPLIPFKYNSKELPLIKSVKTLQDGLNKLISDFQNCMEEDVRNTILVIKNYDGEDLGQFRKNLSAYGAVKVKTVDGSQGGVETLNIEVNADNYKTIIDIFKKAIVENGRGYDAKDDRLSGSPNQMNIMSMYNDIDIDANAMETEFAAALEQTAELMGCENADFVFNRSLIMNESELIDNALKSVELVGEKTALAHHPWFK